MKNLKNDKYFAVGAEALRSLTRFVLGILVARLAGPSSYGVLTIMLSIEILVLSVIAAYWITPMISLAPGLGDEGRKLVHEALRRNARACRWVGLFVAVGAALVSAEIDWFTAAGFGLTMTATGLLAAERGRMAAEFRTKLGLVPEIPALALPLAALCVHGSLGGDTLMIYWCSRAAGALISAVWVRSVVGPLEAADADLTDLRAMGKHMASGSVANAMSSRSQPILLDTMVSSAGVGAYGAATALTGPLRMAAVSLSAILRPRLAAHVGRSDRKAAVRSLAMGLGIVGAGGLAGLVACLVMGEFAVEMLLGPAYASVAGLLVLATFATTLASINSIMVVAIQVLDSAATTARLRLYVGGLAVILVLFMGHEWGAAGALGSIIVAESCYLVVATMVVLKALGFRGAAPVPAPSA